MPPALLLRLPILLFGVLGVAVIIGRLREGRRSPAQWLALSGCCSWSAGAGFEAAWPLLAEAGVDLDLRHLVVNLLNVGAVLAVSLLMTTFGIRERMRPAMVVAAIIAGLIVWWLPGHGAILERGAQATWGAWVGMGLYLGYIAGTVGSLLELGRARYRADLHLAKQVQLRLLQAMAVAALTYVGAKALLFVGVQAAWPGFGVAAAAHVLPVLLLVFAATLWLALAPPNALVRLAVHIEQAEAHSFATAFALQTKEDLAHGRDLGRRTALIALAEQVARDQGVGFDELARLRLAAVLWHTSLDLRSTGSANRLRPHSPNRDDRTPASQGLHPVLAQTVWVPPEVLQVLQDTAAATPEGHAARVLTVVDAFMENAYPWAYPDGAADDMARALAEVERRFEGWSEVAALRSVVTQGGFV